MPGNVCYAPLHSHRLHLAFLKMVEPLYQREDDAVAGPFYVIKDQCIICDLPPTVASKCIRMKSGVEDCEKYCFVHKQPVSEEELEQMFDAMSGSCVQAIRYCGDDPSILRRLKKKGMSILI